MKLVCEAVEAGEAEASTALKERLEKLNEFVKDVNPVLKKWFGAALPEDLGSKINIDAASRYCRAKKGRLKASWKTKQSGLRLTRSLRYENLKNGWEWMRWPHSYLRPITSR